MATQTYRYAQTAAKLKPSLANNCETLEADLISGMRNPIHTLWVSRRAVEEQIEELSMKLAESR